MRICLPFVEGNKEDPVNVAQESWETSGKLCFSPDSWRIAKQIFSYFSRLAAAQEAAGENLVQEAESIRECDIQALETEQQLKEL